MNEVILKDISKNLKTSAEVNKVNEVNRLNALEYIKERSLVFILGFVVGYALFQMVVTK